MAANTVITPKPPNPLKEWCDKYSFQDSIYNKLVELEFQSPNDLKILPNEDVNELCNVELKIKYGRKAKFLNAVRDLKKGINVQEEESKDIDMNDKSNKSNNRQAKTLKLYQSSNQWKLVFYEGTPVEEMKKAIREITNMKQENNFLLLDADGNNFILSSYIPDGTQLHLEIIKPLSKPAVISNNGNNDNDTSMDGVKYNDFVFRWDPTSRTCSDHDVKDNGMTVGQPDNKGWGHTFSTIKMKAGTGIYVWSILFNPIQCCIYSSIKDVRKYKMEYSGDDSNAYPCAVFEKSIFNDAFRNGQGFSHGNEKPLEVIYVCDMNKRKFWAFEKGKNHLAKFMINNLPMEVQPFVTLKHVVWITITGFGPKVVEENKLNISDKAEKVVVYGQQ